MNQPEQLECGEGYDRAAVAPFMPIIDRYVHRFSNERLRYPTTMASIGTRRLWARRFLIAHVLQHGRLPTGEHHIRVRWDQWHVGIGSHDFSDIADVVPAWLKERTDTDLNGIAERVEKFKWPKT
jgi:hypothetical protein